MWSIDQLILQYLYRNARFNECLLQLQQTLYQNFEHEREFQRLIGHNTADDILPCAASLLYLILKQRFPHLAQFRSIRIAFNGKLSWLCTLFVVMTVLLLVKCQKVVKITLPSAWHLTVICIINCAQTGVKVCTYSKNSSTFEVHTTICVHPWSLMNLARSFTFQTLTVLSGMCHFWPMKRWRFMSRNWQRFWRHSNMFCSRALKVFRFSVGAQQLCDEGTNSIAKWRY